LSIPADLAYTSSHEWVAVDGDIATIGVTGYAAAALGDIVFVAAPALGDAVTAGEPCGEVESTKSVSDLSAPVTGEVVEANEALADEPGLINSDPFGGGWIFRVRIDRPAGGLLDSAAYAQLIEGGAGHGD
jgi:glycine cleavage system H protein